jgi:hypothetical protein
VETSGMPGSINRRPLLQLCSYVIRTADGIPYQRWVALGFNSTSSTIKKIEGRPVQCTGRPFYFPRVISAQTGIKAATFEALLPVGYVRLPLRGRRVGHERQAGRDGSWSPSRSVPMPTSRPLTTRVPPPTLISGRGRAAKAAYTRGEPTIG